MHVKKKHFEQNIKLRLFGTETSNSVNLISNLSTIALTAYRVGRLLRPKIGVSALKVATTDSEFR